MRSPCLESERHKLGLKVLDGRRLACERHWRRGRRREFGSLHRRRGLVRRRRQWLLDSRQGYAEERLLVWPTE